LRASKDKFVLTTKAALDAVLNASDRGAAESVMSSNATGRILRQIVRAERDQPPFDRITMDGIGFAWSDYDGGQRQFPIQATQAAGDPVLELRNGHCLEVMTGASRPDKVDCIVPVERVSVDTGIASIEDAYEVIVNRYIHPRGSDFARSAHLLTPGKRISPLDIAVIASCGETHVEVAADPVLRVVSTGNELVAAGSAIEAHQIRLSNGPALLALLESHHYRNASHDHIVDDVNVLSARLATHLEQADVLILSGGVSMGKADYVPAVLRKLGVEPIFHKISQRPGKPMWFGKSQRGTLVFALPGNPVSALVCCRQYVIPSLHKSSGLEQAPPEIAALASNVSFKPKLTCFQPVRLISNAAGQLLAMPVKTNTSGDFAALAKTDGYVELEREQSEFAAGTAVFVHRWIVA
jgi:molybdopterin molybdotransferase